MKITLLTITLIGLLTSCGNAQQKDNQVENTIEVETKEFLSKNKTEHKVKVGDIIEIRVLDNNSSHGKDIVWKNKSSCKLVKQIETNYLPRKEQLEGLGGLNILRFQAEKIGTENIIIEQCHIGTKNAYRNCNAVSTTKIIITE